VMWFGGGGEIFWEIFWDGFGFYSRVSLLSRRDL
jgi:hypothetical protein